jgi:hypothetical protein
MRKSWIMSGAIATLRQEKVESTSTTSGALHHAIASPRLSHYRQSEALVVTKLGNAVLQA